MCHFRDFVSGADNYRGIEKSVNAPASVAPVLFDLGASEQTLTRDVGASTRVAGFERVVGGGHGADSAWTKVIHINKRKFGNRRTVMHRKVFHRKVSDVAHDGTTTPTHEVELSFEAQNIDSRLV